MVAEKICHKAANSFKGCWPLNGGFQKMFSDSWSTLYQLSEFAIKILVKGRKSKFMAFLRPFWPLNVKFWNILKWTRSCQAFSFGFASLIKTKSRFVVYSRTLERKVVNDGIWPFRGHFYTKKIFSLFSQNALGIAKFSKPDPPEPFCRLLPHTRSKSCKWWNLAIPMHSGFHSIIP